MTWRSFIHSITANDRFSGNDGFSGIKSPDRFFHYSGRCLYMLDWQHKYKYEKRIPKQACPRLELPTRTPIHSTILRTSPSFNPPWGRPTVTVNAFWSWRAFPESGCQLCRELRRWPYSSLQPLTSCQRPSENHIKVDSRFWLQIQTIRFRIKLKLYFMSN